MAIWIVLHVLAMFIAFGFTNGIGILVSAIADTRDVRAIRTAVRIGGPLQTAGLVIMLVGVVFGFASAASAGFNLTSTWLVEAYVLLALLLIVGVGVHKTWFGRLARAAAASSDESASPELSAVIGDRLVRIAGPVSGILWILLIVVMVVRPS
ncbi:MAG TPA: hypothetical protein VKT51_05450 [Candidatus Eremiobacteraceae bacterium]|nr:hypothetical protein [Candidatus Eremiobacteraceae bacterium]